MPSSVRAFIFLALLLIGWQCYVFYMHFSLSMPPPGLVAGTIGFVMQEFLLLWLFWIILRRRSLGRWMLLLWFLIRLGLPIWMYIRFDSFSAFWHSLLASNFWRATETVDMLIWAGLLYFIFARASKPWFRKPDAPVDLRERAGLKAEDTAKAQNPTSD